MTVVRDYTGISYAADGSPNFSWNGFLAAGLPVVVSYSFVDPADLGPWQDASSYANDGYTSMTQAQRANVRDALAVYEKVAGIVFVEVASGTGMINAMNTSGSGYGGWASVASAEVSATGHGELVIDNTGAYDEGSFAFQSILHELGHAMGLEHPWQGKLRLASDLDNQQYTVMTYNSSSPFTADLGTLDVDAMRAQYGSARAVQGWQVSFAGGVVTVVGSGRGDRILGVGGAGDLFGGRGDDRLYGREGDDTLQGDAGNDRLAAGGGSDVLYGGLGDDVIYGFDNVLKNYAGQDSLFGGGGDDTLMGANFDDLIYGGTGNDLLRGAAGYDVMYGGDGDDRLTADNSATLYGDDGNDRIAVANVIVATGGAGADRYSFDKDGGYLTVTDFTHGEDLIDLRRFHLRFNDLLQGADGNLHVVGTNIYVTATDSFVAADFVF